MSNKTVKYQLCDTVEYGKVHLAEVHIQEEEETVIKMTFNILSTHEKSNLYVQNLNTLILPSIIYLFQDMRKDN